ncbi:hypothetical protein AAU57_13310 [Nonlabens sp. YIK11]|nr:hypothetical protein AAU57_13310 [Nonlabens sp. YIK11]
MQAKYLKKALLANQYKIERAEKSKNWIGRNKVKVILFGIFMSVVGPVYTHEPDGLHRREAVKAVDVSDFGHMGTAIAFAIFYTLAFLVAYFVWKYQDAKQIRQLKEHRIQLKEQLTSIQQV